MRSRSEVAIRLFGTPEFGFCEEALTGPSQRLLVRLTLARNRTESRGEIAAALWPNAEPDRGRFYLRRALAQLRPRLTDEIQLSASGDELSLTFDSDRVDVTLFDHLMRIGDLAGAVEVHSAPLLPDWPDDWLEPERVSRLLRWHEAIEALASEDLRADRPADAARRLGPSVAADPLRESAQRLLIEALRRAGDPARAERHYERLERTMRAELGVSPSPATREALRRPVVFSRPPAAAPAGPERYLPCALTPIIGRARSLADLRSAVEHSRLVTLVGTAGVGKTRLAIACAEEFDAEEVDLVAMVDLASHESGQSLGGLLRRSVRAPMGSKLDAYESSLRHLENRRALIVLDNCEHVLDASAELARLILDGCPQVRVLATSREALGLPDETIIDVHPLDLGAAEKLLRESAARKGRRIAETPTSDLLVTRICESLDRLPLALTLAAGAMRTTSLEDLVEHAHRILGEGSGDQRRHQSLWAATDWSYRLLSPEDAFVLRSVAPIRGTWTAEVAAAAAGPSAGSIEDVQACLRSLVAKSLVEMEDDDSGTRYRLLETVREDAFRRLVEAGDEPEVRRRLRDAMLEWSRMVFFRFREDSSPDTVRTAERGLNVAECVLEDCLKSAEGRRIGVAIMVCLKWLFDVSNRYRQGAFYLEKCLEDAPGLDDTTHAFGLASLANLLANWGDGPSAVRIGKEAAVFGRRSDDPGALGYALGATGIAHYVCKQYEAAFQSFAEALPHWGRSKWEDGYSDDAMWASKAAITLGKFSEAKAYLDLAEPYIARHVGRAVLLLNRGRLAYRLGSYAEALSAFETSEKVFQDNVDRVHAASARVGRAASLAALGDSVQALELIQDAESDTAELIANVDILYDGLGPDDFRTVLLASISEPGNLP